MRVRNQSMPFEQKVKIVTKEQLDCEKAHTKNKEREKRGKFYEITNDHKKYMIFIEDGKDIEETKKKHLEAINFKLERIHKMKL